jgi:hypothetical protein
LPEREKDVDGVLEALERDLKAGPTREESQRLSVAREKLDDALGDGDPRRGTAGSSRSDPIDGPGSVRRALDRLDEEPPAPAPSPRSAAPAAPTTSPARGQASYDLPAWF